MLTQDGIDAFKAAGCTVIEVTGEDAELVVGRAFAHRVECLFDCIQRAMGKSEVEALGMDGCSVRRRDDALSYVRILKDGDWKSVLGIP